MNSGPSILLAFLVVCTLGCASSLEEPPAGETVLPVERILTFEAHQSWVACLAFSPDSNLIASGSGRDDSLFGQGELKLFEIETGKVRYVLDDYKSTVRALAFSPDGKTVAAGGDTAIVWELRTGDKVSVIKPNGTLLSLAYIPSQNQLVTTIMREFEAVVWDARSRKKLATLRKNSEEPDEVRTLSPSDDGKLLATGGSNRDVVIWNTRSWAVQKVINNALSDEGARLVRLSPQSRILYAKGDFSVPGRIWRVDNSELVCQLENDLRVINDAAFSPDLQLLATASFRGLQIWATNSGQQLCEIECEATAVAFSHDGRLLAVGSKDGVVFVYRIGKN